MKMKFGFLILMAGLCCGVLKADSLSYTVTFAGAGEDFYQFTLSNTGTTGGTLNDLFLAVPLDISDVLTSTIGTPRGWGDPNGGLLFFGPNGGPSTSFIEWTAAFSGADDVRTGSALAGFSFRTLQPITGPIMFAVNDSETLQTAVQGVAVAEPATSTLLVCAFGVFAIAAGSWRVRNRRAH